MKPIGVALALCACLAVAACGRSEGPGGGHALTVVATTTQVADLTRNVGGSRVGVEQILRPNADPHEYEPRPSDAFAVRDARLVLRSGGDVDDWLAGLLTDANVHARTVTLIDRVSRQRGPGGQLDPHWWQDPRNAERAVAAIRDALVAVDPAGAHAYRRNAAAYLRRLRRLDSAVARCIGRVPPAQRKLVTNHDALGYYAHRYGLAVIGALIPSLSTQAQPSAKDIAALVHQIRREHVRAIFPERSLAPRLERAVAHEAGARVGGSLWADALGPKGSSGATYVGSIAANTDALVDGLSGGSARCALRDSPGTARGG